MKIFSIFLSMLGFLVIFGSYSYAKEGNLLFNGTTLAPAAGDVNNSSDANTFKVIPVQLTDSELTDSDSLVPTKLEWETYSSEGNSSSDINSKYAVKYPKGYDVQYEFENPLVLSQFISPVHQKGLLNVLIVVGTSLGDASSYQKKDGTYPDEMIDIFWTTIKEKHTNIAYQNTLKHQNYPALDLIASSTMDYEGTVESAVISQRTIITKDILYIISCSYVDSLGSTEVSGNSPAFIELNNKICKPFFESFKIIN
jgi:hypothetical protein